MEQLEHSEEEIIKLGKKIVKQLDLEYSTDTLARWMSHYLAELIVNVDKAICDIEKKQLQKECCDVILKLWSQKENLPIKKPLQNLNPVIEILQVLNEEKEDGIFPSWMEYRASSLDSEWSHFVDLVKNNSEKLFNKVIQMNIYEYLLNKDEEWMKEHKQFLKSDELEFLEIVDSIARFKNDIAIIKIAGEELHDDNKLRIEQIFDDLENLIDEQKNYLLKLRNKYYLK